MSSSEHLDRAQRFHNAIRRILLQHWDPIGIGDVPEAQDEYDSYIGGIYSRLIHRVAGHDLFNHLWQIETDRMGLYGDCNKTQDIVHRLLALNKEL